MTITTGTLGYPRIGQKREVKKALESFWAGKLQADALINTIESVETANWQTQLEAGIDRIAVGDMTFYDHVLDWCVRLGLIPSRFQSLTGLKQYFAMGRGVDGIPALEMTKWFDTNYHYLVPEISSDCQPQANFDDFLDKVRRSQLILGKRSTPLILSPVTLLELSRKEGSLPENLEKLLPLYGDLLTQLKEYGIEEVQFHEPILVTKETPELKEAILITYHELAKVDLPINLVNYFEDLGANYSWVINLPVQAISLDFTRGNNLDLLKIGGFPEDKRLGVGIIDARNVWKIRPQSVISTLNQIQEVTTNISIQPSASLQFVPLDAEKEVNLSEPLRNVLSFAQQKLREVKMLSEADNQSFCDEIEAQWQIFKQFSPYSENVAHKLANLKTNDFDRTLSYQARLEKQLPLPMLPTTTIGSFPQTSDVRQLRVKYKRGELTKQQITPENRQFLAELPHTIKLDNLCFTHGSPQSNHEYILPEMDAFAALERVLSASADVLFCGHTHIPYVRNLREGMLQVKIEQPMMESTLERQFHSPLKRIINVGSVGEPRHGRPHATYIIYNLGNFRSFTTDEC